MSQSQVNTKALRFIRDHRLKPFMFLVDPDDRVISQYGIRNTRIHEAIEKDVPHPTTYVLDRDGAIRLKDTREDFRIWLSVSALRHALAQTELSPAR